MADKTLDQIAADFKALPPEDRRVSAGAKVGHGSGGMVPLRAE